MIQDGVSKKGFPDIATSTIYKALVDEHEYFDIYVSMLIRKTKVLVWVKKCRPG